MVLWHVVDWLLINCFFLRLFFLLLLRFCMRWWSFKPRLRLCHFMREVNFKSNQLEKWQPSKKVYISINNLVWNKRLSPEMWIRHPVQYTSEDFRTIPNIREMLQIESALTAFLSTSPTQFSSDTFNDCSTETSNFTHFNFPSPSPTLALHLLQNLRNKKQYKKIFQLNEIFLSPSSQVLCLKRRCIS